MPDDKTPQDWQRLHAAAARDDIDAALRDLYAELDAAVAAKGPTCWTSGKCCKFEAYGHLLYVTALEVAWFLGQVAGVRGTGQGARGQTSAGTFPLPLAPSPSPSPACPYQIDNLCTVHAVRPLGCRIFFCQEGTQDWQHELYEDFLHRLRDLHTEHGLPYRYMEWRAGLAQASAFRHDA